MKKMLIVVLAVCLVATVVNAKMMTVRETYIVKEGDTIFDIAKKFKVAEHEIVKDNPWVTSLEREEWNGRELVFLVKREASEASTEKPGKLVWRWKNVGADPFGSRDVKRGVEKFSVSKEVKAGLLSAVASGNFKPHRINLGDRFKQMISGNYKLYGNRAGHGDVVADFVDPKYKDGLNADLYQFDHDGKRYFLVKPYACMNWAWWVEDTPATKEELVTGVREGEEATETKVDKIALPVPDKAVEVKKAEAEEAYPVYRPANKTSAYTPANESSDVGFDGSVFAGHSRLLDEYGVSNYAGADTTLYLFDIGEWNVGVSGQYVGWDGYSFDESQTAYGRWAGDKWLAGIGIKRFTDNVETTFKVRFGEKKGDFRLLSYKNEESNGILNLEAYHTMWFADDQWFHSVEGGVRVDLDQGGSKKSWSGNAAIPPSQDPKLDQSEYSASLKTEIYRIDRNLAYIVGGNYRYAAYDKEGIVTPQVGVKIWKDIINLSAGRQFPEKKRGAYEGNLMIDLDKLVQVF